ncbi:MAG: MarR family winged helix-turn-helix transcriptional regulator [Lachnospiraceae bacterium]
MDVKLVEQCLDMTLRGRKFKKVTDHWYSSMRKKYGLKQLEIDILYFISHRGYGVTAKEISNSLVANKGQVSIALDNLVKKHYLREKPDEKDKRMAHFNLTKEAEPLLMDHQKRAQEMRDYMCKNITKEEIHQFIPLMEKFIANMDAMLEEKLK